MSFSKILCPTDFSRGAEQALRVAVAMAKRGGAELVIAHCWDVPHPANESPVPAAVTDEIAADARQGLEAALRIASDAGATRVTTRLLGGTAWSEIVDLLEKETFDLCVIGAQGRSGLARVLLGSVAESVVRHAPCSVMAVHPQTKLGETFRHALVPMDFSTSAERALDVAIELMAGQGKLTLLHVLELPTRYSGEVPMAAFADEMNKVAAQTLKRMGAALEQRTTAHVDTRLRIGYPGGETLEVLDEDRSFDLVVMGSRGRTGIKRVLLGSVAEKVVRHARCAVLVVRRTGAT